MKKILFGILFITLPLMAFAQTSEEDLKAIEQVALDYFEGYYTGDGERMEKALSPELAKRTITSGPGGIEFLRDSPYILMVESAKGGLGKKPVEEMDIKVEILDTYKNVAAALITSTEYYDLLHIGKINGEWKLINVLWTPFPEAKDIPESEHAAIEAAVRNYTEGLLTGDATRVAKGLSPELAKRSIRQLPNKAEFLAPTTYLLLNAVAKSGVAKGDIEENVKSVEVLHAKGNIASAKLNHKRFTDYLQVGKMNGEWKVINVLFARH